MSTGAWLVVLLLVWTTAWVVSLAFHQRKAVRLGEEAATRAAAEKSKQLVDAGWNSGALAVTRVIADHRPPHLTTGPDLGYRRAQSDLVGVAVARRLQGPDAAEV